MQEIEKQLPLALAKMEISADIKPISRPVTETIIAVSFYQSEKVTPEKFYKPISKLFTFDI